MTKFSVSRYIYYMSLDGQECKLFIVLIEVPLAADITYCVFNIEVTCISYLTSFSYFSGMFGTTVSSSCLGVALSLEQGDSMAKSPTDPSAGVCSHILSGSHRDSDDSPRPEEVKVSHTSSSGKSQYIIHTFTVTKVPPGVFFVFFCQHVQKRVKNARFSRDKMQLQCLDQQGQFSQEDHTRDKIRHRVRQMLSDSPTEENRVLIIKGKREICEP